MSKFATDKILVPVDFSDESISAIDTALDIAGEPAKVHVIHVLAEMNVAEPGVIWQTIDDENRSQHATDALRKQLDDSKYDGLNICIEIGDPGHRVTDYAADIKADLIVMPSHGRRGISRLLIGSVAERIIRLAHCPVLILRN